MIRRFLISMLSLAIVAGLALSGTQSMADVTGRPHDLSIDNDEGHCINCHDLHQVNLGEGYPHNLKRGNEIKVCYQCHAGAFSDYSSIDPSLENSASLLSHYDIRAEFSQPHIHFPRYGMDGEINKCSFCHNPHGVFNQGSTTRKPKLLSAGPDAVTDTDEYCFVCHNSDPNPPHAKFSNVSVGNQYKLSRNTYRQMTHSTFYRATTVTEPVPDSALNYDDNPYGKGKDISCLTCHRPHGSPNDHMLKAADNQDFCLSCHNGTKAPDLSSFNATGHGKPGAARICQDCHFPHGTGQKAAIKTTITDPHTGTANQAAVNASGVNEACFACHVTVSAPVASYSFDSSLSGWSTGGLTQTLDTAVYYLGGGSMKQYRTPAASTYSYSPLWQVSPNTQYTFTVFRYIPAAITDGAAYVSLYEFTSAGSSVKSVNVGTSSAATSRWDRVTYTFTTSSTTGQIRIYLFLSGSGTVYWDELRLGTSSSISYYQGKTAYNSGIHKTSVNALNPGGTHGEAAGDCDNCHNPHGRGYDKMLVDTRDQKLCYDCHNEITPNTKSGRDVKADFQMVSRHDLAKVACVNCHNVHKATQSQVMMDPQDASQYMTDKTVFCLSCHSGVMPAGVTGAPNINTEWSGGGHDNTHSLTCSDCHESHSSQNTKNLNYTARAYNGYTARFLAGMSFGSRAFCEACHNRTRAGYKGAKIIPTGSGYVGQHGQSDQTPCSSCHTRKHNPAIANYTGSSSYYTSRCLDCHTQGTGNPYPNPDADFNTPRNGADPDTRASIHNINYNPPTSVDCIKCHGSRHEINHSPASKVFDPDTSHGSSGPFDVSSSSAFCLECHDQTPVSIGGRTPQNILDTYTSAGHGSTHGGQVVCSACHTHHGSTKIKLIKDTINAKPVLGTYSGDNVTVCTACHYGTDARLPQWGGYQVYSGSVHAFGNRSTGRYVTDGRHGRGTCVNCHNPHGSRVGGKTVPSMLYKKEEEVCYTCHNSVTPNTASGEDVQARFKMLTHHNISDADQLGPDGIAGTADDSKIECEDCHDPHTITERLMAFKNVSDAGGRHTMSIEADQDFCVKCHSPNPPARVKYPAEGVWDKSKYDQSAHGNHLKRRKGFGNYSNGITYPCKVCHNPHGSNQAGQQRESWDINRDGIPDDIDGDGILDSSDTVGFIGYSTGTHRVMLVSSISGIPSRASFKRISTTIPYQANGSIDVEICLNCHDGSPAYDVETDIKKRSHHPVEYSQQVGLGGAKIECYNCHDQHRAQATNEAAGEYATTNPDAPREPMPGDASFCLRCHDNTLPPGVSFGSRHLKNIKLSYNPRDHRDTKGYDVITTFMGHYVQATGRPMMCRDCHNQHGSNYTNMLRDNTEPGKPGYDPAQPVQLMQPVALGLTDPMGGGDNEPLTSTTEHCLACHSGVTTYNGNRIPLPPPPDAFERGLTVSSVGKHPDLKPDVTVADEAGGHLYKGTFALVTTPGSVKEECTQCHDSHNPFIATVDGQLTNCYQCHNENTSLPDTQSEFNDNPTNPTRSNSIHPIKFDPRAAGPSAVECLKCHDQSRHMQGKVRLRKNPGTFINYSSDSSVWADPVAARTINSFCLECHGPDTTVATSFWRGGVEHVPPRLPAGHVGGAHFVNANLLCTDCHEYHGSKNKGLRKNAKGDEETFCYNCHSDPAKSRNGIDIQAKFEGTASHHIINAAEQSAKGAKLECEDCHNPHVVTRTAPVVKADDSSTAAVSDTSFCISCHDSNGAPGVKFPGYSTGTSGAEWDPATGKWNKWNKAAYAGSQHDAAGNISCKKCHDPHGSPNTATLLQNISSTSGISVSFGAHSTIRGKRMEELGVNKVCSACHKSSMGVYNGYAGYTGLTFGKKHGVDKNCTYCHNPHGTGAANLVRSTMPLYMNMTSPKFGSVYNFKGFGNPTTGKPFYVFCSSAGCHASERAQIDTFDMDLAPDNFTRNVASSSHHPMKEGVMGCTACHKEHGSGFAPDLRAAYFRESNWPKLYHSGRGVYSVQHGGGCGDPDPFDGSDFFEDGTRRGQVTSVNPPSNANDLCFMCHQVDDIIGTASGGMAAANTKFLGHEAVKGGATISHNISKNGNGVGSDYHNFSCSACHFPHSSSMNKLLKQGCMSQADATQDPNPSYGSIFQCHSYTKVWSGGYQGWRNLTTAKADFKRPPNPVTNLAVSQDPDLTIHLSWTAVADAPGQGAHHYNVYRSSQPIMQDTKAAAARISNKALSGGVPGSGMAYDDRTCQPNTTYYYAVVACDPENNESFVSNCVMAAMGADTYAPATIADQTTAQVDGTYNVKLTWHDPGDNVNVTQYKVYRKSGLVTLANDDIVSGNFLGVAGNPVTDTSLSADGSADTNSYTFTDATTQLGQDYSYAVVALDAAGNVSPVPAGTSFSVSIIDPAPAALTTLTAKPVSKEMHAQLTWTAPGNQGNISGYKVYRKSGPAFVQADLVPGNLLTTVTTLSYTADIPAAGTDFYFAVTALDQSSGRESKLGNNALINVPQPPSDLSSARLFNSGLKLSWTAPSYTADFRSYKLYVRRNSGAWAQMNPVDNLVSNGSFEVDLTGWTASSLTAARDYSSSADGVSCAVLTGTYAGDKFLGSGMVAVAPSIAYTYSGYVKVPIALAGGTTALKVIEYNSSGGYVTEHTATGVSVTSGWQKLTDMWTTSATTTQVKLKLQMSGTGTAYWDDVRLGSSVSVGTSARLDFTGLEPGNYEVAVTANYGTYGGSTPYESIPSASVPCVIDDTSTPVDITVSGALTPASNYTTPSLSWNAPADRNFTGYTPSGLSSYRIQSSRDQGKTWLTVHRSRLTNPGFETHGGIADDANTDTFTGWGASNINMFAVTDAIFDNRALKIRYAGSGDTYVNSAEPTTGQSVAGKAYSMSFWAKASKPATFQYFIQANGGNYESIGTVSPSIGTEWTMFTTSGSFSSSATASGARVIIRPSSDTSVDITLDGVRLDAGNGALLANDGSFYQPANYGVPGSAQGFDDPTPLVAGTSARYRIQAVDAKGNISGTAASTVFAKPAAITDLTATSSQTSSANVLMFSAPVTLAGLSSYKVYGKEQGTALVNLNGATLLGTVTPAINHGGNIAAESTPSASHVYSTGTNYAASNVVDGNTSTYWYGKNGVGPNYLTLAFGSPIPVYKVSLSFYSSTSYCPKDYLIQTYDGSAWVTRVTVTNDTSMAPTYTLSEPVNASQVRIYITETRGGMASYFPIIGEFMVYPGEKFTHNLQNTALKAEVGHTYAYAVIAEDVNAVSSDISSGPATVRAVQDKDGPDKVTDLSVTSPVGTTQVMLNWSTPLDNLGRGSTGATGYEIYRLPTGLSGTPMPVTDSNFNTASLVYSGTYASSQAGTQNSYTATWYDHEGVNYAVRSKDSIGNWSPISNSPFIVVGKDTQAPSPPVITECIPVDSPEVDVYWNAAADNIGVNGYRLYRADVNVEPFLTDKCITENNIGSAQVAVNLISYYMNSAADEGGTPGNTYYYALRAWDDENNMSNISNCAVATVRTTEQDTTSPTWRGASLTAIQQPYPDIDLIWTSAADLNDSGGAGSIDHYEVYRSQTSFSSTTDPGVSMIATVSGIRNSYSDRTGDHEATYYYALVAVDAATAHNRSAISNVASAQVAPAPSPDNAPPSIPGSLAVSTGVYPDINIYWTASTDVDDSGTGQQLLYYKLYRSRYPLDITEANKQNPAEVDTVMIACDATSYTARGIGGTQYNYRLEAFDMAGNGSGLSVQLMGQVAPAPCVDSTPPRAPADLNATIGPSPDIDLSWTASIDDGGVCSGQIDHYLLYKANYEIKADTDLRSLPHIYVGGKGTSYTDSTGIPNTQYWYVLTAVDTSANESASSNIITGTTGADTMAPASVTDLKATPGTGEINLTWCRPSDNVGIHHYEIYRKEQGTIMTDADITLANKLTCFANGGVCLSCNDAAVLAGHTYSYAVIAVDGSGNRSTISRGQHDGDTVGIMP